MATFDMKAHRSLLAKQRNASRTPEERAVWLERVREGTRAGARAWQASRTPEQRQQASLRMRDAALCRSFSGRESPGTPFQKGYQPVNTPKTIALRSLSKVQNASVKRILRDVVGTQPDLLRDAIIEGLQAPPPRSFPYIALAAAYLDGKPINTDPPADGRDDLSDLTGDQLMARALAVAAHLRQQAEEREGAQLPVIDVAPTSEGKK
ncbi:MAG: hypothetical protein KA371_20405 [Acidobacteria bacterium]|nr:hypothetical protein [Acidobacteriota bacterium]